MKNMTPREELIEAIERSPDWLIQDLLARLHQRIDMTQSSANMAETLQELQKICLEEDFTLTIPLRQDRINPFAESNELSI
jgi:hypothetical protein